MADSILEEDIFPIVGWAGPGGDMIRDDVMAGMSEAGFTVSHSSPHSSEKDVSKALDIAHKNGVKLILVHPEYHVGDDFRLNQNSKKKIREFLQNLDLI